MNKLVTNVIVNFLRINFFQAVNFWAFGAVLQALTRNFLLDSRETLWYYYSIKIGKKSAHFWVTCVLFAFCRRLRSGHPTQGLQNSGFHIPLRDSASLAGARAQITGLPRFQFAGGNANEKTKVHKTCMLDHGIVAACEWCYHCCWRS